MQFNTMMDDAPKDQILVLAIPSGDPEDPVEILTGSWDDEEECWRGPWRIIDGLEDMEPVAWAPAPEVTPEVEAAARTAMAEQPASELPGLLPEAAG